jgi:hypothetical protein
MTRGKAHPPELRANAEALLLAGHSQSEVCSMTGLDSGLVSRWAARLEPRLQQLAVKKTESDAELIMGYFRAALRAMTSQVEVAGDPDYCRSQDADKLAIFHGVIGDKLAGIATTAKALGLLGSDSPTQPALGAGVVSEDVDATRAPEATEQD